MEVLLAIYLTPETERIAVMLFISALAHIFIIYAVGFIPPEPMNLPNSPIKIILVQSRSEKEPKKAESFAQDNQDGGGDSEQDKTPATPTIAPFPDKNPEIVAMPPPESQAMPLQEDDIERLAVNRPSTHQVKSRENTLSPEDISSQGETQDEKVTIEVPLTNTLTAEIQTTLASIQAELDAFTEARAKRPKKIYFHELTPAQKRSFVPYMEAWKLKAERIGTAYYRKEAQRNPFSGEVDVMVAINQDGTIGTVEIIRFLEQTPTRRQLLEEAVRRIAHLTTPFKPFSKSMRETGAILYMPYHWNFKHGESIGVREIDP